MAFEGISDKQSQNLDHLDEKWRKIKGSREKKSELTSKSLLHGDLHTSENSFDKFLGKYTLTKPIYNQIQYFRYLNAIKNLDNLVTKLDTQNDPKSAASKLLNAAHITESFIKTVKNKKKRDLLYTRLVGTKEKISTRLKRTSSIKFM